MLGSIRWNLVLSIVGFVLTFVFSLGNNVLITALLRAIYSFAILFVAGFILRFVLGSIIGLNDLEPVDQTQTNDDPHLGGHVDLSTPDEDEAIAQTLKMNLQQSNKAEFSPLNPPKLASKDKLDPEELAQAVRHMSEE